MGLIRTLLRPDHEEEEMKDRLVVIAAANILQVGEFQLLQLAYREWFEDDLPEALVARLFGSYMLKNEVPHWARHYARHVLDMEALGLIDEGEPSYHRYDVDYRTSVPRGSQKFWSQLAVVALVIVGSIYIAHVVVKAPTTMLPPYFDEEHFKDKPGAGAVPLDDDGMD